MKPKSPYVIVKCENCGGVFSRLLSHAKKAKHTFCSLQCRYDWTKHKWKEGKTQMDKKKKEEALPQLVGNYREGGRSKTSKAEGTIKCPKCGKEGQLKKRTTQYKGKASSVYLQVDHYKTKWHGDGYSHSCYLGVV